MPHTGFAKLSEVMEQPHLKAVELFQELDHPTRRQDPAGASAGAVFRQSGRGASAGASAGRAHAGGAARGRVRGRGDRRAGGEASGGGGVKSRLDDVSTILIRLPVGLSCGFAAAALSLDVDVPEEAGLIVTEPIREETFGLDDQVENLDWRARRAKDLELRQVRAKLYALIVA